MGILSSSGRDRERGKEKKREGRELETTSGAALMLINKSK